MVLVDTSVWIRHFKQHNQVLSELLQDTQVSVHEYVIGELACGELHNRAEILSLLGQLPRAPTATYAETLLFIEQHQIMGRGVGYVDAHLLASAFLTDGLGIWSLDKRLRQTAAHLGVAYDIH